MINFLTILIVLVCILLILVILIQNSKGGGLTSGLAGNAQLMGVRKTTDFLEKATWTLAIALVVLSLLVNMLAKSSGTGPAQDTELREKLNTTAPETKPLNMPSNTTPAPGGQTPPPAGAGQ
jgi:preprotein translocase subunit SecG